MNISIVKFDVERWANGRIGSLGLDHRTLLHSYDSTIQVVDHFSFSGTQMLRHGINVRIGQIPRMIHQS